MLLIRHGESEYNVHYAATNGCDPGDMWDAPLTALGREQALEAGRVLAGHAPIELALTSPLSRACETCLTALPPASDNCAKRYMVCGAMSEHLEASCDLGKSPKELASIFPALDFSGLPEVWWFVPDECGRDITVDQSRRSFKDEGRREPESVFHRRVAEFLGVILARKEQTIAAFAHADFFNTFLRLHCQHHDPRFADYWMKNCEILKIEFAGREDFAFPEVDQPHAHLAVAPAEQADEPVLPEAPSAPARPSVASVGLAKLRSEIAESSPELTKPQLARRVSAEWRQMSPGTKKKYVEGN